MKMKYSIGLGLGTFLAVSFLLLIMHGSNVAAEEKPQNGGVFKVAVQAIAAPSKTLGIPWESRGLANTNLMPVFEVLVRLDRVGEFHPELATAWEIAPDKSSITFNLRKGVKFHDGSDFNADAAAWNIQKRIDNHYSGTSGFGSVETIDDYTVRINFTGYNNYILDGLANHEWAMVSKASYEQKGDEWCRWNPIGTGPFVFESYQRDVVTKFRKNSHYWRQGFPYLDGTDMVYIKDVMTQQAAFMAGEVDCLNMEASQLAADFRDKGFPVLNDPTGGMIIMVPDSKNPDSPFSKKEVREAVSYAIDREAIVKARGYGFWMPAYQTTPEGRMAYIPGLKHPYDPNKAKQLLKEAGYPDGFKTRIIPMVGPVDKDEVIAVQAYLAAVGIDAQIETVPHNKYSEYRFKGWNNGLLLQPFGMYTNANHTYESYFSEKIDMVQFPALKRPDGFQDLLKESVSTISPEKELVQKLNKLIYDNVSVIPLNTTGQVAILQKNIHDTEFMKWNTGNQWTPYKVWKSK